MIEAHSNKHKNRQKTSKLVMLMLPAAALIVTVIATTTTTNSAQAILIPLQEHWKYNVRWDWDPNHYRTIGYIDSKIMILNHTTDRIIGYIGDQNGTRLSMYKGDQYVQTRYGYNNGFMTKWKIGNKINDGYFTIDIPVDYRSADVIGIYVGNNEYTIDDGTPHASQTPVFINSARMDYYRNSTMATEPKMDATAMTEATSKISQQTTAKDNNITKDPFIRPSPGSLIDLILNRLGLLQAELPSVTNLQSNYYSQYGNSIN